ISMLERILSLPLRQRFLIYGGGAMLIVLLYIFLFHIPRSVELEKTEGRLVALEKERAKLQAQLKDREKSQAEIREVEGRFNEVKAQLPEQKEIPELLRQVSNLGRDSGLEVSLFPETRDFARFIR